MKKMECFQITNISRNTIQNTVVLVIIDVLL